MKIINGGVTAAKGYMASGVYAGIKKKRNDMALVYSSTPAKGVGTFTTNVVKAAPVKWGISLTEESEVIHGVVLNSGVANACTGELGEINNKKMAVAVAKELNVSVESIYTASTGVIGVQLPIEVIENAVPALVAGLDGSESTGTLAAEAIMTTDTYSKQSAISFVLEGKEVTIGGMAKGSGMIHPNMATMLAVITTDVAISKELLQEAISQNVKYTFNMISVDRDTSTNDSYFLLANGLAGNEGITEKNEAFDTFCEALRMVTTDLSKKLAADGEGANKLFEAKVVGAKVEADAMTLSKSIISSNLVKTAVFGNDANWGRILCAMGYAGVDFDPEVVDLSIESEDGKLLLFENGVATGYSEEIATKILSGKSVTAIADLKQGNASATAWGCDLSYDYVKINADYRS